MKIYQDGNKNCLIVEGEPGDYVRNVTIHQPGIAVWVKGFKRPWWRNAIMQIRQWWSA